MDKILGHLAETHVHPPAEPVRVGRFEWERLMLMSPLPRATKGILLVLGVFMSEDGGDARPGLDNLTMASGRSRSVLIEHLAAAVAAGYLHVVERGGFRRKTARATEYAAVVPKQVWVDRDQVLRSPPWRRTRENERRSGNPDIGHRDEGPENRTLADDEGPVFGDEGPVFASRTSGKPDPTTQFHHAPNTTSPLPPADLAVPSDVSPQEGGKEDSDPQTQRINTLTAAIAARRPGDLRWTPDRVRKAIRDCLAAGKTLDQIERAFPLCEADPDTASPARLPLPFPWWDDEPDCDRCNGKRTIVGHYASGPRNIPCSACRREPLHDEKCNLHPRMPAWNCGACRADRATKCPHPDHNDNADNCSACWAHVKAHQDPFQGIENLRPKRWQRIYGAALDRQQRSSQRHPNHEPETACAS